MLASNAGRFEPMFLCGIYVSHVTFPIPNLMKIHLRVSKFYMLTDRRAAKETDEHGEGNRCTFATVCYRRAKMINTDLPQYLRNII
jgi:hypothetical protein